MACITHFACECFLKRMDILEKIARAASSFTLKTRNLPNGSIEIDMDNRIGEALFELVKLDEKENKNGK